MVQRAKLFKAVGSQMIRLPEVQEEVLVLREGEKAVLEPARRSWSREFLELAGSAPDFPCPEEPPSAEAEPDLE